MQLQRKQLMNGLQLSGLRKRVDKYILFQGYKVWVASNEPKIRILDQMLTMLLIQTLGTVNGDKCWWHVKKISSKT